MKINKILLTLLTIFVIIVFSTSTISAEDLNNDTYNIEASNLNIEENVNTIAEIHQVDGSAENQMNNPTIQTAINNANAGDTIEVTGKNYEHCHFVIDKKLTIISNVGTTLSTCPSNTQGSDGIGIFYISPKASGTVISGFTLINDEFKSGSINPYGIYINGAKDVTINNVTISKVSQGPGIYLKNADNIKINNSIISNSKKGIYAEDSSNLNINYNEISSNYQAGIYIGNNVENLNIFTNAIQSNNYYGIYLSTIKNVNITNNRIEDNRDNPNQQRAENGAGIYVNNTITNLVIKGNLISYNGKYGIYNSDKVTNLKNQYVEIVDENYFIGHLERAVFHLSPTGGSDIVYVWSNYYSNELFCGGTYYAPDELITNHEKDLVMSPITEIRNGVYKVSFINPKTGKVATSLSSINVIFYLNKVSNTPLPEDQDIYKEVPVINGTAIVDFRNETYATTGNTIVAQGPGIGGLTYEGKGSRPSQKYNVPDSNIPNNKDNKTATTLVGENVLKNVGENAVYEVILRDNNGVAISNALINFEFNGKTLQATTNSIGIASTTISLNLPGTYPITATYLGNNDYLSSTTSNTINIVNLPENQPTTLVSENLTKYFEENGKYNVILTSNNIPLANKTVTITINGISYNKTTNKDGIAQLTIRLNPGLYATSVVFAGDENYKSSSCTGNIQVINKSNKDLRDLTSIKSNDFKEIYGENKQFEIILFDKEHVLANQQVEIEINGMTYSKITDNNGKASLTIRLLPKNYSIKVKYLGNNLYQPSSVTNTVTVISGTSKINTQLITNDFTEKFGENKMYSAKLVDENGKGIANQNVVISVNGADYTKVSDENGIAKLTIRLGPGNYKVTSSYAGNTLYNSATTKVNEIMVKKINEKIDTIISVEEFSELYGENKAYTIELKDINGNPLVNQNIDIKINGITYSKKTDENGIARLTIRLLPGDYPIESYYSGNNLYNPSNKIAANLEVLAVKLVGDITNDELQEILNYASNKEAIKLANPVYNDISLNINKPTILTTTISTINGAKNKDVIVINGNNSIISGLTISTNNGSAIVVKGNDNQVVNNIIKNNLDSKLLNEYASAKITMPGYGIAITGANNSKIANNTIYNYYNGIFLENSNNTKIIGNSITKNNYGIEFGYNATNTLIKNNNINNNTGLITLAVVEGPLGYGISLKHSGVNVTILDNNINNNYMGIFIDAKNCTNIIIIGNSISNSTIEGLTFNENYTYAKNAVQPIVTNNAIYNNAKGPSMIILGEVSANPAGIYGPGEWNDTLKLRLGPNWYGTNTYTKWGENVTGVGTICPRISTTLIHYNLSYSGNGVYTVKFYNNETLATQLPDFTTFFTLNFNTDKEIEQEVLVHKGVATFSFPAKNYYKTNNTLEGSSGSLFDSNRIFPVIYTYNIPDNEIQKIV